MMLIYIYVIVVLLIKKSQYSEIMVASLFIPCYIISNVFKRE